MVAKRPLQTKFVARLLMRRRGICNAQGCSGLARIRAFLRLRDGLRTDPQGSSPSSVPVYGPLYKAQRLPAPLGSSSCCEWATVCACTQAPG